VKYSTIHAWVVDFAPWEDMEWTIDAEDRKAQVKRPSSDDLWDSLWRSEFWMIPYSLVVMIKADSWSQLMWM